MDRRFKGKKREIWLYISTIVLSILFLFLGNRIATKNLNIIDSSQTGQTFVKARVEKITNRESDEFDIDENTTIENIQVYFDANILSGDQKGETVPGLQGVQYINNRIHQITPEVKQGDKVLIRYVEGQHRNEWQFMEFVRADNLLVFGIIFLLALVLFGRVKGVNTILSLAFTCITVFAVFVPSVLSGMNIYMSSIVVCFFCIIMTFLIVSGGNKKTITATAGCFSGIIIAGLLTVIMVEILIITGFVDEGSLELTYLSTESQIDLRAIVFASIIIGALGAIMDVAMSIASSLWEVKEKTDSVSIRVLFKSGMNIGRDIMSTMANTLILAYIGSSLSTVLLLYSTGIPLMYLFNRQLVVVEIMKALTGSFGILFVIPLTSFICSLIYTKDKVSAVEPITK